MSSLSRRISVLRPSIGQLACAKTVQIISIATQLQTMLPDLGAFVILLHNLSQQCLDIDSSLDIKLRCPSDILEKFVLE